MKRGLRVFSLLLLILLVFCSFTSVFAEDTNNVADGLGDSNLNDNIDETTLSDINSEEELMEADLSGGQSLEASLSDGKELAGTDSSAEETLADDGDYKSFRDLYVAIVTNPMNLTLTEDYKYNPEKDGSLTVVGIPNIYEGYVIDGQGHTIDASNSARFFVISANNATLKNINFINGNSSTGSAVHFSANGTIENCTFSNNHVNHTSIVLFVETGHIIDSTFANNTANESTPVIFYSEGFIDNCFFLENNGALGGAARFNSKGKISNSRFKGNNATLGGAIYGSSSDIFVNNSVFISNLAELGGAINLYNGTLFNSSFDQNVATSVGGAIFSHHLLLIDSCTFQHQIGYDGGAVYCNNLGSLQNSIFKDNTAVNNGGAIFFNYYGEAHDNNFTNNRAGLGLGRAIYCKNTLIQYLNSFEDESSDICSNRTFNFKVVYVDGSIANSGDGSILHPYKTLYPAIQNCSFNETILMHSGTYSGEGNTLLSIENFVNILADGEVILDGKNASIFEIIVGANIEGVTFKNGFSDYGGAIKTQSDAYVVLKKCKFLNNQAVYNGGAIYSDGYLEVNDCFFSHNNQSMHASESLMLTLGGGAITGTFPLSMLFIRNSSFENNSAAETGGAIQAGAFAYIDNCIFKGNAARNGGAIRSYVTSNLLFSNAGSTFISNHATDCGGAIFLVFINAPVHNLYFENNSAIEGSGGAIFGLYGDNVHEHGSQYTLHLVNCTFIRNKAGSYAFAGAIGYTINNNESILCLDGCYFKENTAWRGGAIYSGGILRCIGNPTEFIENSVNYAKDGEYVYLADGGAIMHYGTFDFSTTVYFIGNSAFYGFGGAISVGMGDYPNPIIANAVFIENNVRYGGGGAISSVHDITIANCAFRRNYAYSVNSVDWIIYEYEKRYDIPGGVIYSTKDVTFTLIKNEFLNVDFKYNHTYVYGYSFYNWYGTFVLYDNHYTEAGGQHDILGAQTPYGIVQDSYPKFDPWDYSSDISQFMDVFILSNNNTEVVLNKDYLFNSDSLVQFPVYKNLVIDGQGHTIKGNGEKLFKLMVYGDITFKNLNFEGLNELISIYDTGRCNFINCNFSSNYGGDKGLISVYDSGVCNAVDSSFIENSAKNGGVISVFGSGVCYAVNSKFISNHASTNGGAIYSENEVNVKDCLFDSNYAEDSWNSAKGGAIYSKVLSVDNCTFVNNNVTGFGGAIFTCKLTPIKSTFNENAAIFGGAIYIENSSENLLDIDDNSFYNNIAYDRGGALYINNSNLHLKLRNNVIIVGGPAYCIGFAVYTRGDYDGIIFNYWGDDLVDFENEPILVKKDTPRDIYFRDPDVRFDPDNPVNIFPLSYLQREINSHETIALTCDYAYNEKLGDTLEGVNITRDKFVIDGQGHFIDGKSMAMLLNVKAQNVILKNIIFINGISRHDSAVNGDDLKIYNCSFINNVANVDGGALSFTSGKVVNCSFINNTAGRHGGAVHTYYGELLNCSFINNAAGKNGGAVLIGEDGFIKESKFLDNHAVDGGAVYFYHEGLIYDSSFTSNVASNLGGAIYSTGNLTLSYYMNFNENEAKNSTENYYLADGAHLIILDNEWGNFTELQSFIDDSEDSVIKLTRDYSCQELEYEDVDDEYPGVVINRDNLVIDGQGHILNGNSVSRIFKVYGKNVTFKNIVFIDGRKTLDSGGAIDFAYYSGSLINCTFRDNMASVGGAVYFVNGGYVEKCIFNLNFALFYQGGAVYCWGDLYINNVTFKDKDSSTSAEMDTCYVVCGKLIDVTPRDPNLSISVNNVSEIFPLIVEIGTNDTYSGNVTLEIAGVNYTVPISNGYGNISIEGLKEGIYTATVTFNASGVFTDSVKSVQFEIYPKPLPDLNVDVQNITVGEDALVEIRTNDAISGLVSIQIADINSPDDIIALNYVVVYMGYGSLAIENLDVGTYIASAFFKGSDMFSEENASAIFKVYPQGYESSDSGTNASLSEPISVKDNSSAKKIDSNLKMAISSIRVGKNAIIKITANKKFSGKVKVKIGSKNYTVNVVKGKGSKAIKGLKVGTYKATAKLAATKDFKASTKTVRFKVKPHVIKLSLKKVTVKRSAKKLPITATLRVDGKLAKGKKLIFIFKGKKYAAKTNKKGVAKITINKNVLKKLKVGKKVTYQVKYGKKSVKRTVKVKK